MKRARPAIDKKNASFISFSPHLVRDRVVGLDLLRLLGGVSVLARDEQEQGDEADAREGAGEAGHGFWVFVFEFFGGVFFCASAGLALSLLSLSFRLEFFNLEPSPRAAPPPRLRHGVRPRWAPVGPERELSGELKSSA